VVLSKRLEEKWGMVWERKAAQSILIHFQQRHCDMEFPGGSVVRTAFSLLRAWAQPRGREKKSTRLSGTAKKKKKKTDQ